MKKSKTPQKKPGKKPGAPPGNKNALKHGFYAQCYTVEEKGRLEKQETVNVEAEIGLLRVYIDRLTKQINFKFVSVQDMQGNITRDDHYLKQLNTLSLMAQSLGTLTRTQHLITGKGGEIIDTIQAALEEIRLEQGL